MMTEEILTRLLGGEPVSGQTLSEELGVQVLDRAALILDIFAQRARTREGRLQVELAQYQYLLPRLLGMWTHLERQEGAIGTRGPGETQLETDRRHIRRKIQKLREELEAAKRSLIATYCSILDVPNQLEDFQFGQNLAGLTFGPDELAEIIRVIDAQQVVEAAQRIQLDTSYFLMGPEGGEEDAQ